VAIVVAFEWMAAVIYGTPSTIRISRSKPLPSTLERHAARVWLALQPAARGANAPAIVSGT
jgi:hypothetical protein